MGKSDRLSAGLNSLLGGRTEIEEKLTSEPVETADTSTHQTEASAEEENELINSIEDEELKEALRQRRLRKAGRPRKSDSERVVNGEKYTRFTTIVDREQIAKLKEIGFRETLTLKEILEQIFGDAIEAYEKTHGELKPKVHKGDPKNLFK